MKARTAMAGLLIMGCAAVTACGDDDDSASGGDDVGATCEILGAIDPEEAELDSMVAKLDELLVVAPASIESHVQLVRDRLAEDGGAAFDDPEVGAAIEVVAEYEGENCV